MQWHEASIESLLDKLLSWSARVRPEPWLVVPACTCMYNKLVKNSIKHYRVCADKLLSW